MRIFQFSIFKLYSSDDFFWIATKRMQKYKFPGPDDIPDFVLKQVLSLLIVNTVTFLFNKSFQALSLNLGNYRTAFQNFSNPLFE